MSGPIHRVAQLDYVAWDRHHRCREPVCDLAYKDDGTGPGLHPEEVELPTLADNRGVPDICIACRKVAARPRYRLGSFVGYCLRCEACEHEYRLAIYHATNTRPKRVAAEQTRQRARMPRRAQGLRRSDLNG